MFLLLMDVMTEDVCNRSQIYSISTMFADDTVLCCNEETDITE